MPKENKKNAPDETVPEPQAAAGLQSTSKPQLLRVSTIIKNNKLDAVMAQAVMTANRLQPTSRMEPAKFLKLVERFRMRKIKQTGRR